MPQWIHDRAKHIQSKNPDMDESTAWAIATQQSHALGKSPKGYGTAEGRSEAKAKYDTPKDDKKTADPGNSGERFEKKASSTPGISEIAIRAFTDEMAKIANLSSTISTVGSSSNVMATNSGKVSIKSSVPKPPKFQSYSVPTDPNQGPTAPAPLSGANLHSNPPAVRT